MPISIILVKGIGPATEKALNAAGITTAEKLATSTMETLVAIPGFSETRARSVIAHARQCVADASAGKMDNAIIDASNKDKKPKQKTKKESKKKKSKPKKKKKEKKTKKDKDVKKKTKKRAAKKKAKKK